jgi:hypothetical protein
MKAVGVEEVVAAVSAQLDRWQTSRGPIAASSFKN